MTGERNGWRRGGGPRGGVGGGLDLGGGGCCDGVAIQRRAA